MKKDSAFSWLVCFCSFMSHVFHSGYSFAVAGNIYYYLPIYLGFDSDTSNWIVSLHLCLRFLCGIPSSILIRKTSVRFAQMAGGLCVILSHALCAVATQPWQLFLLFGVVGGFGVSCCYTASSEILRFHFRRHIYLSTALVIAGCFVGVCVNPLLVQTIVDEFGFGSGMGVLAAFHLVHIIAGVFYIEASDTKTEINSVKTRAQEKNEEYETNVTKDTPPVEESVDAQKHCVAEGSEDPPVVESVQQQTNEELSKDNSDTKPDEIISLPLRSQLAKLLKSIKVWLYLANMFLRNLGIISFYTLIGDYMRIKLAIEESEAVMGVTISGALGLVGVVLVASVSQLKFDRMIIQVITSLAIGVITIVILFSRNLTEYYASMILYGVFYGASIANMLGISYGVCGPEQMILLHSMALACESIGSLVGAPLCAMLAGNFGSKTGMVLAGCCDIAAVLILLPTIIQKSVHDRKSTDLAMSSQHKLDNSVQ